MSGNVPAVLVNYGSITTERARTAAAHGAASRHALPAILFAVCLGAYIANRRLSARQRRGRQHAVQREPAQAPLTLDQPADAPQAFFWTIERQGERVRVHLRGLVDRVDRRGLLGRAGRSALPLLLREPDRVPGGVREHVRHRRADGRAAGCCWAILPTMIADSRNTVSLSAAHHQFKPKPTTCRFTDRH